MSTHDSSIVRLDRFIQATRDSGYRGTPNALAELVDNSIEAGATEVNLGIVRDGRANPMEVFVADNGCGMTAKTLRNALRFGGSSRFESRDGLGRYGMGLPNASLSQCRRVEVITWRAKGRFLSTYLDLDMIASGQCPQVPEPVRKRPWPTVAEWCGGAAGTVVHWIRADRLDNRRISTVARKLHVHLGRVFRHYIWDGVTIRINGVRVVPIDPLFIAADSLTVGGTLYDEWSCEVRGKDGVPGVVHVRFSTLPVLAWHHLPVAEKRTKGITNGAGVSVVRAGREIDYGWHFLGGKRRQNYDDWWRCEVRFEPILDEAFGITHTKQQIRPTPELSEALATYMATVAQELHTAVRSEYRRAKESAESGLEPVVNGCDSSVMNFGDNDANGGQVRIVSHDSHADALYTPYREGATLIAALSPSHPIHQTIFGDDGKPPGDAQVTLAAVLAAAARAEEMATSEAERRVLRNFRHRWDEGLRVLLADGGSESVDAGQ